MISQMRTRYDYEWVVEELDVEIIAAGDDDPDIVECSYFADFAEALAFFGRTAEPKRMGLCRNTVEYDPKAADWRTDGCTDIADREYAYFVDGRLPDTFEESDGAADVPAKFRRFLTDLIAA